MSSARVAEIMVDETDRPNRELTPEARRALAEAAERRAAREAAAGKAPVEVNGRGGLDPVRYDDWEVKGIASDF
ncbi:MAG: DUF1674 domain-containing protein [Pseudomonadota bacterium]